MQQIENLLPTQIMGRKFDTRKGLNRSTHQVPDNVLTEIEAGNFTCEMINQLSGKFPIFHYQTQITIHGNFGPVTRNYIGGYKNIFQNQNGSVGIKWSAIDTAKINQAREMLYAIDCNQWHFLQDSQRRLFRMQAYINKTNYDALKAQYIEVLNRVKKVDLYGYCNLYIQPTMWGDPFICLDVNPLAIPEDQVKILVLHLTGLSDIEYEFKKLEVTHAREKKAEEDRTAQAARDQRQQEYNARYEAFTAPSRELLGAFTLLTPGIIVVKFDIDKHHQQDPEFIFNGYCFYKCEKGKFGRLNILKASSKLLELENLQWADYKTVKPGEMKTKGYLFPQAHKQPAAPVKIATPAPRHTDTVNADIKIVKYSDKAIAVIGNTYPVKDTIKAHGGAFNKRLTIDGTITAGWVIPITRSAEVRTALHITN